MYLTNAFPNVNCFTIAVAFLFHILDFKFLAVATYISIFYCLYKTATVLARTRCHVVLGLLYGDEGKGKVVHTLGFQSKNRHWLYYTLGEYIISAKDKVCIRFSGANNAGHTVYHDGTKIITHSVPTGIVNGDIAIIGQNCLVNPQSLKEEMEMLQSHGVTTPLYLDRNAHVILDHHIQQDCAAEDALEAGKTTSSSGANGSTKKGVRFAAADKYNRTGKRVKNVLELFDDVPNLVIVNTQHFLERLDKMSDYGLECLCEGAQGYGLDPDTGDYPWVTSTGCNLNQVYNTGLKPSWIDVNHDIWGVAKFPVSYVGKKNYMRHDRPDLIIFQKYPGCEERGSTTDRWRQIDYVDLDMLVDSINFNGVNNLVINKCDIVKAIAENDVPESLQQDPDLQKFKNIDPSNILSVIVNANYLMPDFPYDDSKTVQLNEHQNIITFYTFDDYMLFIEWYLRERCSCLNNVIPSYAPDTL